MVLPAHLPLADMGRNTIKVLSHGVASVIAIT